MKELLIQSVFILDVVVLLAAIAMHLVKRNSAVLTLYVIQSVAAGLLLLSLGIMEGESVLIIVALLTLSIKAIAAPIFFSRLIQSVGKEASFNTYFSTPISLLSIMGLLMFAYSEVFRVFSTPDSSSAMYLPVNFAVIFISMFLMYNRRGALGQIIGVLSIENGVVLLAALMKIAQPLSLEVGIVFDLILWIIIAQVFISMVYKQFGTLNVTEMRKLTEE
jgi:hydrogenase-4 component E